MTTVMTAPAAAPLVSRPLVPSSEPDLALEWVDSGGHVVGIVGLGYVGLPTALALADAGSMVIGCDISSQRLSDIRRDRVDLLDDDHVRLRRHLDGPLLRLVDDVAAMADADTVIVCVPTPVDAHLVPDLTGLSAACAAVVAAARPGQTIILTSTTYVGSTRDLVARPLAARGLEVGVDVCVAFAPERIDPGNEMHTQSTTPRVVGGITEECTRRAAEVIERCSAAVHRVSSPECAEATKLLENTFRAVNIALANEFASVSRRLGLDIIEVIRAAATKPYGFVPFYPGPGVGGHCIPCDPHYLLWQLRAQRVSSPLIESAMTAIAARPTEVASRAQQVLADRGQPLSGASVLVVGVTYKAGVADVRESPALEIISRLTAAGARVAYHDRYAPVIMVNGQRLEHTEHVADEPWDLVLVHTVHPDVDHDWIRDYPCVLDASYRLDGVGHRAVV